MKSEQEEIAELVRLLEAAETKVKELLPLHALVSTMVAATHGNVDGPGEEWKYPQVQEIVALFAQVASLEKEREDCRREHPPEQPYLDWSAAGMPDVAKEREEAHARGMRAMLERLGPYFEWHGTCANHHRDDCPGEWPAGTPWGTRDPSKPCDACAVDALSILPTEAGEREKK